MTVFNLGSINEDRFYSVPHLPRPGETLPASSYAIGLGGKGSNQSVAVALAGSDVRHIGMIGAEGGWLRDRLAEAGVDVRHVATGSVPTGHANVYVDIQGENMIVIFPGANRAITPDALRAALAEAATGDTLILQNETTLTFEAARMGREKGLRVVYSAAPFEAEAVLAVLPFVDLLVLNEIEAEQLAKALGKPVDEIAVPNLLVTRGSKGALWRDQATGQEIFVPAFPVKPVDTTGAGDCFIGYVAAGLDQGLEVEKAMRLGAAASALQVTREGTADAIPLRAEVDAFLSGLETQ